MDGCKFKVGDTVYCETALRDFELGLSFPKSLHVDAIRCEECSGGTQFHLLVSNAGKAMPIPAGNAVSVNEAAERIVRILKSDVWTRSDEFKR